MERDEHWLRERARQMRHTMPDAEALLWTWLKGRRTGGFRFRRQHVLDRYIVDFFCTERRLAVEIDGDTHDSEKDARRDRRLRSAGIGVLRFTNAEVFEDVGRVAYEIRRAAEERQPHAGRSIRFPPPG